MIRDGERYNGVVSQCAGFFQSPTKGTTGFSFSIRVDEEEVDYTIWIKPEEKSRERAKSDFSCLGVTTDQLASQSYLTNRLAEDIIGREVSFTAQNEEFQGKWTMKASFLGRPRSKSIVAEVAELFGGAPTEGTLTGGGDDDIPFSFLLPFLLPATFFLSHLGGVLA